MAGPQHQRQADHAFTSNGGDLNGGAVGHLRHDRRDADTREPKMGQRLPDLLQNLPQLEVNALKSLAEQAPLRLRHGRQDRVSRAPVSLGGLHLQTLLHSPVYRFGLCQAVRL